MANSQVPVTQASSMTNVIDAQLAKLNADRNRRSEAEWRRVFHEMERHLGHIMRSEFVRSDHQCQQHLYNLAVCGDLAEFNEALDKFQLYLQQLFADVPADRSAGCLVLSGRLGFNQWDEDSKQSTDQMARNCTRVRIG